MLSVLPRQTVFIGQDLQWLRNHMSALSMMYLLGWTRLRSCWKAKITLLGTCSRKPIFVCGLPLCVELLFLESLPSNFRADFPCLCLDSIRPSLLRSLQMQLPHNSKRLPGYPQVCCLVVHHFHFERDLMIYFQVGCKSCFGTTPPSRSRPISSTLKLAIIGLSRWARRPRNAMVPDSHQLY